MINECVKWETTATRETSDSSIFNEIYEDFKSSLEKFYDTMILVNRKGYHSLFCSFGECIDESTQVFNAVIEIDIDSITIRLIADNWYVLHPVIEYSKNILQRVR